MCNLFNVITLKRFTLPQSNIIKKHNSITLLSIIVLLSAYFTSPVYSQETFHKNQINLSWFPQENYSDLYGIEYQRLTNSKLFYFTSIQGSHTQRSSDTTNYERSIILPAIGAGFKFPFAKIFKLKVAGRISYQYFDEHVKYKEGTTKANRKLTGFFIGPDLGLEMRLFKTKKLEFCARANYNIGFGYLKEDYYNIKETDPRWTDPSGTEFSGIFYGDFGVGVKFK